jgi:hypothetical protein
MDQKADGYRLLPTKKRNCIKQNTVCILRESRLYNYRPHSLASSTNKHCCPRRPRSRRPYCIPKMPQSSRRGTRQSVPNEADTTPLLGQASGIQSLREIRATNRNRSPQEKSNLEPWPTRPPSAHKINRPQTRSGCSFETSSTWRHQYE